MKVVLIYRNGQRYSYKGFKISEMINILIAQKNIISDFECHGWDVTDYVHRIVGEQQIL